MYALNTALDETGAVSVVTGLLYQHSRAAVAAFSVVAQLASIPVFIDAERRNPQ